MTTTPQMAAPEAVDPYDIFVRAYFDPTSETYSNAKRSYALAYPTAAESTCQVNGSKLLRKPEVEAKRDAFLEAMRQRAALTGDEFLVRTWSVFNDLAERAKTDPRYASALPKLAEVVGKAGAFLITKTEDMTPPERKFPGGPDAILANAAAIMERMKRLNVPNPLPTAVLPSQEAIAEHVEVISDGATEKDPSHD